MIPPRYSRLPFLLLVAMASCSFGTGPEDKPATARVRVTGTAPEEMKLIVSTDFIEQFNLDTGARSVQLQASDTLTVAFPYDETWDTTQFGDVYVELLYEPVSTASITLRVELDNGESFEQAATMSAGAQLIYYWVWRGQPGS